MRTAISPDRYEPNDTIKSATILRGNQHIVGSLDSAFDVDHYIVAVGSKQTHARIRFTAPHDVICEVLTSSGWRSLPSSGVTEYPASEKSSLVLRVRSREGKMVTKTNYTVHTSDPAAHTVIERKWSDESITHMAPFPSTEDVRLVPGGSNAAREINVTAAVYDSDGDMLAPAGEHVTLFAVDYDPETKHKVILAEADGYTDATGHFTAKLRIGDCRGPGIVGPVRMHRHSNRPEYWDITYVPTAYVVAILDDKRSVARPSFFQHVCKETYRGLRP